MMGPRPHKRQTKVGAGNALFNFCVNLLLTMIAQLALIGGRNGVPHQGGTKDERNLGQAGGMQPGR
jgi:hypothetical protein